MADEDLPVIESTATPEMQAEAEAMGWIPPARYKGEAERFVDADEFIRKGKEVLPIVKKTNERLKEEIEALRAEQLKTNEALVRANRVLEEIEERHAVDKQRAIEQARADLKAQLAAASEAGNHAEVAELTDQLTQLQVEEKEAREEVITPPVAEFVPPSDLIAWQQKNPWFGKDKRKTALALAIGQEIRDSGVRAFGAAFYKLVDEELAKEFGGGVPESDKVMGNRGNGALSRGAKTYASMPKEARDACDADISRFVGKDKKYKTAAEWQTRYAELYYGQE